MTLCSHKKLYYRYINRLNILITDKRKKKTIILAQKITLNEEKTSQKDNKVNAFKYEG